jgi:hypothetical protein
MARYESRDISFDVPRHWDDRTLVAFAAPPHPSQAVAPNVVMTRDTLGPTETLRAYADKQLAELAKRLDGFELGGREVTTLGGRPAVVLRFGSKGPNGPIVQRLAVVEGPRRGVWCLTLSASKADAEQSDPLFDRILSTVRVPRPETLHPSGEEP